MLECLALCFVTAVRVSAGTAYIDLACGTFAVVAVVNAVVYVAVDTVILSFSICTSLLPQLFAAKVVCA